MNTDGFQKIKSAVRKMKFNVTVVALMTIVTLTMTKGGTINTPENESIVEIKWMNQRLNHFDDKDDTTWKMRYMVNEKYFESGGPMFISMGGEWKIEAKEIDTGIFPDIAKEHKGILFSVEHRYYGESHPTSDFSKKNLKYLHSRQVLADLAHFIRIQRKFDQRLVNSKVILAGASYGGSLVVWFTKLYPDLVNGAWASSAPLVAKLDFKEYHEQFGQNIRTFGSQQCYNRIQNGISKFESMFESSQWDIAKSMLLMCDTIDHNNSLDLSSIFYSIANTFTNFLLFDSEAIPELCDFLMTFKDDLSAITGFYIKEKFVGDCFDVSYRNELNDIADVSLESKNLRPWIYQLCNEFGWHTTTTSRLQPFGTKIPYTLHIQICRDAFGPEYTYEYIHTLIDETNKLYGGAEPNVRNVYITYGDLDPWKNVGSKITEQVSIIPGISHCSDLKSISSFDSPELCASKERLKHLVKEWLN